MFLITNVWIVAASFTVDVMVDFKRFVGLSAFECCCRKKLLTAKRTYWFAWTHFLGWWFFFFCKIFVVMGGICANDFFRLVLFLKSIMGGVLKAFYKFDVPVIGAVVLLEYLLDLVTLDYILWIKVYVSFPK